MLTMKKTQTNPRSLANLKKWEPGQSGNPSGRPHKRPITDRYREILETLLPDEIRKALSLPTGATHGDAIALAQARQAIKGRTEAAREIREAIEGRTAQRDDQDEATKGIRVVIINGKHRPNRETMRPRNAQIDVSGLAKPQNDIEAIEGSSRSPQAQNQENCVRAARPFDL